MRRTSCVWCINRLVILRVHGVALPASSVTKLLFLGLPTERLLPRRHDRQHRPQISYPSTSWIPGIVAVRFHKVGRLVASFENRRKARGPLKRGTTNPKYMYSRTNEQPQLEMEYIASISVIRCRLLTIKRRTSVSNLELKDVLALRPLSSVDLQRRKVQLITASCVIWVNDSSVPAQNPTSRL